MSTIPVKRGQVCDNCRFRKVKCDRGLPSPPGTTSNSREDASTDPQLNAQSFSSPPTNIDTAPQPEPEPESDSTTSPNDATIDTGDLCKRMSLSLVAHVRLFQRFLYPIMPVVDDDILADAARLDDIPPSRYALILAICAATRMQLRLDKRIDNCENDLNAQIPAEPRLTGDMLVNLAETSLRQYSVIDDTTLDSVLVSFFLFASYGNLNDPRHAWFYLNQSITLAQSLDLTKESGYYGLPAEQREKRRRVFWLLFVTERTFALQHRRSVMLRSTVNKPQIVDSNCPVVMHDFINHIRLFESLPYSLYEWQPEGDDQRFDDLKLVNTINEKLCSVQPDQSIIESQGFDTLITQQWLRISMWRIAFGQNRSSASGFGLLLPPSLPMDAGKIIMSALGSVGTKSKDCHGIGMEQKLFDVGVSLADTAQLPGWTYSALENGPRDLLSVVIHALSAVRGAQSHLLPNLLKHSETLFALADPNAHIDLQWDMQDEGNDERLAIVEELSPEDGQPVDPLGWVPDGNLDLLDLSTPVVTTTWEDATISCGQFDPEIGLSFN
ncbi:hypothetical protein H9Q72_006471 [Fusarium xylarioides]|uniref:Xylanolytic transcriptional activator regulatory domain-containing protein n=1 Tax=Fusarium xylarioides TaxID=221167 RepID=A0A9P7L1G4_9HYPO|nr:hypothetical protein H9Q72_006471 [Fusarium xylarioides]